MEFALVSRVKFYEILQLLEVTYWTVLNQFPNTWSYRTARDIEYHSSCNFRGGDYFSYDPWTRQNVYSHTVKPRPVVTSFVPKDGTYGLLQVGSDVEMFSREPSGDCVPYFKVGSRWCYVEYRQSFRLGVGK